MGNNRPRLTAAFVAVVTLIISAVATGCSTSGCNDNRSSIPLAGFYSASTGDAISLNRLDIGGVGAPNDSLLLVDREAANEVYLPLRADMSPTSFYIAYRYDELNYTELIDTITFYYTTIPYFASEECGAMMRYRIDRLDHTRHLLDSVAIIPADSIITNVNAENMRLYFITSEQ